ncbi:MAG: AMP-binding protein, partial [bacterium]|nr:AMP-binding protein [bacterium]
RDGLLALESLHPRLTVLFSSISAILPGVTSRLKAYAEANQWLDDYARAEHRKGRRIISLAWAPWARVGMAAEVSEEYRMRGLDPIEPELAVLAMQYAVSSGLPHVAVFHRRYDARPSKQSNTMDIQKQVYALIQKYTDAPLDHLRGDRHLMTLGVDSLLALDIVKELETLLGCSIPTTFLFEYDTLDALIEGLKEIQTTSQGSPASPHADVLSPARSSERIPLLDTQKTFLVHQQFFPEVPCNVFLACSVETPDSQPFQEDDLRLAVQVLTQRHPVLRSVVVRDEGQWFQRYGANMPEVHWVASLDDETVANTVLDLEHGPLLHLFTDGKRLAVQGHHLLLDAWSAKLLMEELLLLVQNIRANASIDTSPIFPDWQHAAALLRDNASSESESDFWKERLRRLPPLPLPWDGDPSAPPTGPAHMLIRRSSQELTRNVEEMARRDTVTMASIVLASYAQLLFDRSGQHDLLIRVAHARRDIRLEGVEQIVGSFADSFPVRIVLRPQETPSALAKRLHRELIAVRKHSEISSISLAQQKERSMAGPEGLTPAGFSFANFDSSPNIGEFRIRDVSGGSASGFTRLGLICFVFENRLCFSFNFLHSHFHPETVSGFAQHIEKILEEWTNPSYTLETEGRLDGEIVAACDRYGGKQLMPGLSFHELAVCSHALASKLHAQTSAVSGSRVALFANPGIAGTLGIVGILRSGAAYVPLDPAWPDLRIESILREAEVSSIVVAPECITRAASLTQGLPSIVADVSSLAGISPSPLHPASNPDAYMMFTSGSTGRPKGARVSHQAVLTLLNWGRRMLQIQEDDCFSQSSSLAFGASLRQTFSPILSGASAVSPDTETKKDPHALLDFLATHHVTIFNSVPSVWAFLMDALQHRHSTASLSSLRWVLIGGEGIPIAYVTRWKKLFPNGPRLVNLYGAAETIANVAWFEVPSNFVAESAFLPIGWPRFGMHVHLENTLDGTGEMVISGPIAEGYLRPEDEGFAIDSPRNARSFRSGDRAFYTTSGALVCVGRKDNQLKIHGHRVELGEIEAALCEFPGIRAARIEYADGYMTAHIEAQSGQEPQEDDIRDFLAKRLPAHMIPNAIVLTKALPRTSIGKIARTHTKKTAPSLEMNLSDIWEELLRLSEPPQSDSDFFALGGDSMLAIEMAMRFEDVGGRRISPLLIHTHRRFGQLLSVLGSPPADSVSPIPRIASVATPSKSVPLGPVQRGFWLASQRGQEPLWTIRLPLKGSLQWEGFQAAVKWIQERHPILRTEFTIESRKPKQRPGAAPWIPVQFDDLSALPEDLRKSALEQRFAEELSVRLSIKKGEGLVRMKLCRLDPDMHVLFVTGHHILTDAHSAWVLLAELFEHHDNVRAGKPLPTAVPETKYLEVASIPQQQSDPFWSDYLKDLPPHASAARNERVNQAHHFELSVDELSQLRAAAAARNTSPFGLVFLAAGKALLDVLNVNDLVLATAISGRDRNIEAWSDAVGPFAYGIPVRIDSPLENDMLENLRNALSHASTVPDTLPGMLGVEGVSALGRYFISWLETSALGKIPRGILAPQWQEADLRFHTESTATDISISILVHEGFSVHIRGTGPVESFAESMQKTLKSLIQPRSALIVYAPKDVHVPFQAPNVVETVSSAWGMTDLVLLPLHEGQLGGTTLLKKCIREAIDVIPARIVALAGMLPSLTGLGMESLSERNVVLTTGHAATVVAMFKTVQTVLNATEKAWEDLHIGVLGFGAIGQATLQLCVAKLGQPRAVSIADPRFGTSVSALLECDMILGAASTGLVLDVDRLKPGTIVIDDSFPRAFDDEKARQRMERSQDVLLLGGGMLDVGVLERTSPFPQAAAIRSRYPAQWLPGCHAEALLLTVRPELGPTVGPVELRRSLQVLEAVETLGWKAAPLHLGPKEVNLQWYVHART